MDLRQNQLPWSDQIWAKINADLAQALAQSRRVRTPFEVFSVVIHRFIRDIQDDADLPVRFSRRDPFQNLRFSRSEIQSICPLCKVRRRPRQMTKSDW